MKAKGNRKAKKSRKISNKTKKPKKLKRPIKTKKLKRTRPKKRIKPVRPKRTRKINKPKRKIKNTRPRKRKAVKKTASQKPSQQINRPKASSSLTPITNKVFQPERMKILVLVKPFKFKRSILYHPVFEAMKQHGEIRYWSEDGSIVDILGKLNWKPDFILQYDEANANAYSPHITDLNKVDIPKGSYVHHLHERPDQRRAYILENNVDLLFAASKQAFLRKFPECEDRFRELPSPILPADNENKIFVFDQCARQLFITIKEYVHIKTFSAQVKKGFIPRKKRLNILVLIKKIDQIMPKHQHKYDMIKAIERFAHVGYWHKDGDIRSILKKIKMKPDFIFHYDIEWKNVFSPVITNLHKVNIPKACYVLDIHWRPNERNAYFHKTAKPDLIFSATKNPFLKAFPECLDRLRWAPFSVNTEIIKDYQLKKDIDYSLMGLLHPPGRYPFREKVLEKMSEVNGFVHFEHPGQRVQRKPGVLINSEFARAINRTKLYFTCGSMLEIPVAKFFEGPGCRSLLMAKPNQDILDLGFKDGINFIACDEKNFYRKAMYYQANPLKRDLITQNGYNFIQTYHNNDWRAYQFVSAMDEFLKRKQPQ